MTKKIFIAALVFFLIAAGIAGYIIFLKPASPSPTPVVSQTGQSGSPYQPFPLAQNQLTAESATTSSPASPASDMPAPVVIKTLTEVYNQPVAGAAIEGGGKAPEFIRLTDRATGHIFDINLSGSTTGAETELSDTTIPKMQESLWLNNGSTTILRYLDDSETTIKTYSAALVATKTATAASTSTPTSPVTISGTFLPDNIESVSASPTGKQIVYLTESASGITASIANPNGSKAGTIFSSAIIDWDSQWPSATTIALTTKASSVAEGYLYFVSTKGAVQRILGDIPGLVTLVDPSATLVAYSDSSPSLNIYDISNGSTVSTGLSTIAEKCVWSAVQQGVLYCAVPNTLPQGHFPDSWYQGSVSFSDSIYRIDANDGQTTLINNISQTAAENIDATNMQLSVTDDYLTFTNKNDLSLWALQLMPSM